MAMLLGLNQRASASLPGGQRALYRVSIPDGDTVVGISCGARLGHVSITAQWSSPHEDVARIELKEGHNGRLELQRRSSQQLHGALLVVVEALAESTYELAVDLTVPVLLSESERPATVVAGPGCRAYLRIRVPQEEDAAWALMRVEALPLQPKTPAGDPRTRLLASFRRVLPTDADAQWRSEGGVLTVPVAAAAAAQAGTLFVAVDAEARGPLAVSYSLVRRRPSSSPPFAACSSSAFQQPLPAFAPLPAPAHMGRPAACASPSPPASASGYSLGAASPRRASVSPPHSHPSPSQGHPSGPTPSASATSPRRPSSPRPHWFSESALPAPGPRPEEEEAGAEVSPGSRVPQGRSASICVSDPSRASFGDPRDLSPAVLPPSPPSADPAKDPGGEAWPAPAAVRMGRRHSTGEEPSAFDPSLRPPLPPAPSPLLAHSPRVSLGPAPPSFSSLLAVPPAFFPPGRGHPGEGGAQAYGARRYSFPAQCPGSLLHDALEHARQRRYSVADSSPASGASTPLHGPAAAAPAVAYARSQPTSPRGHSASSPLLYRRSGRLLQVNVGVDSASPLPNGATIRRLEFVVPEPSEDGGSPPELDPERRPAPFAAPPPAPAARSPVPAPLLRFTPPVDSAGAALRPAPQAIRVQAPACPRPPPQQSSAAARPSPHAFSSAPPAHAAGPPPAPRPPVAGGSPLAPAPRAPVSASAPLTAVPSPAATPELCSLSLPPRALEPAPAGPARPGVTPSPSPASLLGGAAPTEGFAQSMAPLNLRSLPGLSPQ
eukprot:tig00000553_g2105.t1